MCDGNGGYQEGYNVFCLVLLPCNFPVVFN